jgi:hypothetical protein
VRCRDTEGGASKRGFSFPPFLIRLSFQHPHASELARSSRTQNRCCNVCNVA